MIEEKIVPTPSDEYRFRIVPNRYWGTPEVTLQRKNTDRWTWTQWDKVKTYSTINLLDDDSDVGVKEYVEKTMRYMWNEHVKDNAFRLELSEYWKDEDAHAGFDVVAAIEASTETVE